MKINPDSFEVISYSIGGLPIKIARIKNPESLFDELLKKDKDDIEIVDEQIPYWAELWPSAIGLSEFISDSKELFNNKNVLEIGCGLGLPGIVAAKCGAIVTLTDYLENAIEFAAYNWRLNHSTFPKTGLLDWRKPDAEYSADIILASDVAYESKFFKPLSKALKHLLKPGGTAIISEPNRKFASGFFEVLKKEGFKISTETRHVHKDGIDYRVSIHLLKL